MIVETAQICREERIDLVLHCMDKAYAMDKVNELDSDIVEFPEYTLRKEFGVDHTISEFHTRVEKVLELNLSDKLKGLLLQEANLDYYDKHILIGALSGSYVVHRVSAALSSIYCNTNCSSALHETSSNDLDTKTATHRQGSIRWEGNGRIRVRNWRKGSNVEHVARQNRHDLSLNNVGRTKLGKPTFCTSKTSARSNLASFINDSGASLA